MSIDSCSGFKRSLVSYDADVVRSAGAGICALSDCILVLVETSCNAQRALGWWGAGQSGEWSMVCRRVCKRVRFARASRAAAKHICRCAYGGTRPIGPTSGWTCCFCSSVMSFVTAGSFLSISGMIRVWRGTRLSAQGNWGGRFNNRTSRSMTFRLANNSVRYHWQWGRT